MPTALFVFLSRPYFNAILSEMGKDHYAALKRGLKGLHKRVTAIPLSRTATKGKVAVEPRYSFAFSILANISNELTFKLMFQPNLSEDDAEVALNAFLDIVEAIVAGTITPEIIERLGAGRVVGRTLLLAYDFDAGYIVTVDPIPHKPREE